MSTAMSPTHSATAPTAGAGKSTRLLAILVILAGLVMVIAGIVTWAMVQSQLADENITVAEDAARFGGEPVDGPFTAYEQAQIIEKHALEASDGRTYAELEREDPRRETVMNGSFLRASLFTSVLAFGVSAMAIGLGIVVMLLGWALLSLARRLSALSGAATGLAGYPPGGPPPPVPGM